ncbi:MAG: Type II secretion system protein F [Thermoanaerobacterales bacterium 50_218]|nr:MAG: Type II secretion system protein F [Thermoanaerobacterales bacterium 50_218]
MNKLLPILILVLVFLAAFTFVVGLWGLLSTDRLIIEKRVQYYTDRFFREKKTSENREPLGKRLLHWGGRFFASLKLAEQVEKKLARADLPLRGEEFLFLDLVLACGAAFFLWILTWKTSLVLFGFLFFLILPWVYLQQVQHKRLTALSNQLADFLTVMTNSLRAGYSFLQALEMVVKEMPPPISVEFGRTLREMHLGTEAEVALSNLSRRVGSEDLDLLVTAFLIQRQVGGNLAEILDNIAATIRERVRIKGEIRTLTAQGRISGLIIGILPVVLAFILFLISPSYIGVLFTDRVGLVLLGCAVLGELLGVLVIRRIVSIEV